jgi:hypothetical protein
VILTIFLVTEYNLPKNNCNFNLSCCFMGLTNNAGSMNHITVIIIKKNLDILLLLNNLKLLIFLSFIRIFWTINISYSKTLLFVKGLRLLIVCCNSLQ